MTLSSEAPAPPPPPNKKRTFPKQTLYRSLVNRLWHLYDCVYYGWVRLHAFACELVPHESERRRFKLKLFHRKSEIMLTALL